jgi:hypothetical protein
LKKWKSFFVEVKEKMDDNFVIKLLKYYKSQEYLSNETLAYVNEISDNLKMTKYVYFSNKGLIKLKTSMRGAKLNGLLLLLNDIFEYKTKGCYFYLELFKKYVIIEILTSYNVEYQIEDIIKMDGNELQNKYLINPFNERHIINWIKTIEKYHVNKIIISHETPTFVIINNIINGRVNICNVKIYTIDSLIRKVHSIYINK